MAFFFIFVVTTILLSMKPSLRTLVMAVLLVAVMPSASAQESSEAVAQKYNIRGRSPFDNPAYLEQTLTPNTISVSFGMPYSGARYMTLSPLSLLLLQSDWLGSSWYDGDKRGGIPGISVDWRQMIHPVISLGTSVGYSYTTTWGNNDGYTDGVFRQHTRTNYLTTVFQMEITYLRRRNFTMYGLLEVGFGMRFQNMTSEQISVKEPIDASDVRTTRWQAGDPVARPSHYERAFRFHFVSQTSPLGFRWGRKVGGYFELGYGYRGFFSAGVDWQF